MATYRIDLELVKSKGKTIEQVTILDGSVYDGYPVLHFTDGTRLMFTARWQPDDAWVEWEWLEPDGDL